MENAQLTVLMLADEALRIVRSAAGEAIAYVIVLAAASTALELFYPAFSLGGGNLLISLLDFIIIYPLIRTFVARSGLRRDGMGGFWTYLGTAILASLATFVGLLLLVIPGLVLVVRWAPAYGFVIAGKESVKDALGKAWDATSGHSWPILATILIPFAISILGGSLFFLAADEVGTMPLAWLAIANLLIFAGGLATIAVGLAAYSLLSDRSAEIAEVFD